MNAMQVAVGVAGERDVPESWWPSSGASTSSSGFCFWY